MEFSRLALTTRQEGQDKNVNKINQSKIVCGALKACGLREESSLSQGLSRRFKFRELVTRSFKRGKKGGNRKGPNTWCGTSHLITHL